MRKDCEGVLCTGTVYKKLRISGHRVNKASCRYLCENLHNCSSSFESQILTTHLNEMQVIVWRQADRE
jgi:hypothetical protein